MNRWRGREILGTAFALGAVLYAYACSSDPTPSSPVVAQPSGDAGDNGDSGSSAIEPAGCKDASISAEGCICPQAGATRDCYRGVPGPKSACSEPGKETCAVVEQIPRWGACVGGSAPDASAPKGDDACFDDFDNDCDGVVDNDCYCQDAVEMCQLTLPDGGALDPVKYTFLLWPPKPVANERFDVLVLSKRTVAGAQLSYTTGSSSTTCEASPLQTCGGPGTQCAADGWNVVRLGVDPLPAGDVLLEVFVPQPLDADAGADAGTAEAGTDAGAPACSAIDRAGTFHVTIQ